MTEIDRPCEQRSRAALHASALSSHRTSAALGTVGLMLGFLLGIAVLTVRLDAELGRLGSVILRNPNLCWAIAISLMLGGAALIKQASRFEPPWSPTKPGQRFQKAVLYTRTDCPLCDEATRTLQPYGRFLPLVREVDIDSNPALRDQFGNCVPVLELDGQVRFRGHVSERLLQRLIEGTPAVDS